MTARPKHTAPGEPLCINGSALPAGPFYSGKVAILVDGEFFLRRFRKISQESELTPEYTARALRTMCRKHARKVRREIYRVFFYDCVPFDKKLFNPISRKTIDYKRSEVYQFRTQLHQQILHSRKFALRLGKLHDDENARWLIDTNKIRDLLSGKLTIDKLQPGDLLPNLRQKQVDMKIGVDIASLALKKQVDTIILIAGDGDFVPAAKLARREGVDFILDPMHNRIQADLFEHIDGMHSVFKCRNRN